jgi:hypothetical protein
VNWLKFFSLPVQIKLIYSFVKFVATKKVGPQIFLPSSFVAVVGSGIGDRGSAFQDREKHPESATLVSDMLPLVLGIHVKRVGIFANLLYSI